MTDPTPTVPPPTPGDALVGRVINYVGALALVALLGIIVLAVIDLDVPEILENLALVFGTALATLLAGRTQR